MILAAAALLFALNANAQLGVVAGLNLNSTDAQSAYEEVMAQNVTNYHAGIVYKLNLPMGLFVQPGVIYNMKGSALSSQIASQKVDIDMSTGYLEIPVRAGLALDLGLLKPYVFAEPYAGYAITTESKAQFENETSQSIANLAINALGGTMNTTNKDANKWEGRERLEYGVGVGAGVTVMNMISVSAKYYWDMGKMFTEGSASEQASAAATAMYEAVKTKTCNGIAVSAILYF